MNQYERVNGGTRYATGDEKSNIPMTVGGAVGAIAGGVSIYYSVKNKKSFWVGLGYFMLAGIAGHGIGWGIASGVMLFTKPKADVPGGTKEKTI